MDRKRQAVQHIALNIRLNKLNVHHLIGDRQAEERMRLRVRAEHREGNHIRRFISHNLIALANRANAAQFRNAIAIHVDPHIGLNIENLLRRNVRTVGEFNGGLRITNKPLLIVLQLVNFIGVRLNLVLLIPHRHQLAYRGNTAMGHNRRIIQADRVAAHKQFFGRHRCNTQPPLIFPAHHAHIIHSWPWQTSLRIDITSVSHHNLNITRRIRVKDRQRRIIQATHINGLHFNLGIPEELDNPHLPHQGVLEGGIENLKTRIVPRQHIIDVIRRLLRRRHILSAIGGELHNLLATKEHTHQARQDRLNRIPHIAANNLRTPVFFIPKWRTTVVLSRHRPQRRNGVINVIHRIVDFRGDNCLNVDLIRQVSIHPRINRHIGHALSDGFDQIGNLGVHCLSNQSSDSASVSSSFSLGSITFAINTTSRWRFVIGLVIGPPTNHALQTRDAAHLNSNNSQ